jgi:hypothetical protein
MRQATLVGGLFLTLIAGYLGCGGDSFAPHEAKLRLERSIGFERQRSF